MSVDAIDLSTCVMHGSCDPTHFPISGGIERVEVHRTGRYRGDGFVFYSDAADLWPETFSHGVGGDGGPLQFTSWAGVRVEGQIHFGGFIQHWKGARGTGAPWLAPIPSDPQGRNNYNGNWAYNGTWGPMYTYVPQAGDPVWLFLVQGNSRAGQAYEATIQARTSVVQIAYPTGDEGLFSFASGPEPPIVVTPPVTTPPVPQPPSVTPAPSVWSSDIIDAIRALQRDLERVNNESRSRDDAMARDLEAMKLTLDNPPVYDIRYIGASMPRFDQNGHPVRVK